LATITAKGEDWIKLDRPLPVRVDLAWKPEIHKFMPMIDGSAGLEGLTIQFPYTAYPGHFLVRGVGCAGGDGGGVGVYNQPECCGARTATHLNQTKPTLCVNRSKAGMVSISIRCQTPGCGT